MNTLKHFISIPFIAALLAPLSAHAVIAPLIADVHVALPSNAGTSLTININKHTKGVFKFDLSTVPIGISSAEIAKASLVFYTKTIQAGGKLQISSILSTTPEPWTESTITNQFIITKDKTNTIVTTNPIEMSNTYYSTDITQIVQAWINKPSSNLGLVIEPENDASFTLDSKESTGTGHAAYIDISLKGPAGAKGDPGADGKTILSGEIMPSLLVGSVGDFYIDTISHLLYGPKTTLGWGVGRSLNGPVGAKGVDAFTATRAAFVQPAVDGEVSVSVGNTAWMSAGQAIYIAGGGYYSVTSINDGTTVSLRNLGYVDNAASATQINASASVSPAGVAGSNTAPIRFMSQLSATSASQLTLPVYAPVQGYAQESGTENYRMYAMPVSCKLSHLSVKATNSTWNQQIVTVRKSTAAGSTTLAASTLSCMLTGQSCVDSTHSTSVAAGDFVSIELGRNGSLTWGPGAISFSFLCE